MINHTFHVKQLLLSLFLLPVFSSAQHFSISTIEVKPFQIMPLKANEIEQTLAQSPLYSTLSGEQKEWFYWTNYSRLQPKAFWDSVVTPILKNYPTLNTDYSASLKRDLYKIEPLPMLLPNKQLVDLAAGHANDLAKKKSNPSHNSANGETFQQRMEKAGIKRCAAENMSFGPSNAVLALVLLYIDERLPDLGHRKNLLNPSFKMMGIGISSYPNNIFMVVQDLACDQSL
jgi:hypothetical protein